MRARVEGVAAPSRRVAASCSRRRTWCGRGPTKLCDDPFPALPVERQPVAFELGADQLGGGFGVGRQHCVRGAELVERSGLTVLHQQRQFGPAHRPVERVLPGPVRPFGSEVAVGERRLFGVAAVDGLGEQVDRLHGRASHRDRAGAPPPTRGPGRHASPRRAADGPLRGPSSASVGCRVRRAAQPPASTTTPTGRRRAPAGRDRPSTRSPPVVRASRPRHGRRR